MEIGPVACRTLRHNRPDWQVIEADLRDVDGSRFVGVDLVAAGVPCPPFSIAGKQLGHEDERDLFPQALDIIEAARPQAVILENVRNFAADKFAPYRRNLVASLRALGYECAAGVVYSSDFGVPQLRPRYILVALRPHHMERFVWPGPQKQPPTVGEALLPLMAAGGWPHARVWAARANSIAPTLVGGSKKHGGPDLGPTRARKAWRELGVDGLGIANAPPDADFPREALPRLTLPMVARLQGFPEDWAFAGTKTAVYRQIGNALPPPVARAFGIAIAEAIADTLSLIHNSEPTSPY